MTKKLHNLILIVLFTYKSPNVRDIHVISVFSCLPVYLICNVFFYLSEVSQKITEED